VIGVLRVTSPEDEREKQFSIRANDNVWVAVYVAPATPELCAASNPQCRSLQCSHFMGPQLQEQVPVGHLIPAQDLKSNIRTNNSDDVDAEAINRTG